MSISDSAYIRRFFSLYSQEEKDKVRGLAFYPTDYLTSILPEDVAVVGVIRSPHAGATFTKIDASKASQMPGILKIITAKDIPQNLPFGKRAGGAQLILAESQVRYRGEPVALVVAEAHAALLDAMAQVEIDWNVLPERKPEVVAEITHHQGLPLNGDYPKVSAPFSFPKLQTRYLEAESGWVKFQNRELEFHMGALLSESQRVWVAQVLGTDVGVIRAKESPLGGQFGGRQQRELLIFLALSSWLTQRSTCLYFDPAEQDTGSYGYSGELSLSYDSQSGELKELSGIVKIDAGSYEGGAAQILQKALEHAACIYDFESVQLKGEVVLTPTHPRRAHRGEGLTAVTWVTEQLIERVVKAVGKKSLEFRQAHCRDEAQMAPTILKEAEKLERPFRLVPIDRSRPIWEEKPIVGRGLAFQCFNPSSQKEFDPSEVAIELTVAGTFVIRTANLTLDLHAKQALAEVASRVLKTHPKAITVEGRMRTDMDPAKPARRETYPEYYYLAQATWHAAAELRDKMVKVGQKIFQSQHVELRDGALVEASMNRKMGYREMAFTESHAELKASYLLKTSERPHGCSAGAISRVSFHPLTGELRVESVKVILDAGPVLYSKGLEIQLESAISWAMAALFSSDLETDQPIPTPLDGPEDSMLVTLDYPLKDIDITPPEFFGSRGIADVMMSVILASVVNAIYEAKGVPLDGIPMSLEFMYPKRKQQTVLNFPLKR
jgi:CO/xanthine dehydrogenase Mo-binding subunit